MTGLHGSVGYIWNPVLKNIWKKSIRHYSNQGMEKVQGEEDLFRNPNKFVIFYFLNLYYANKSSNEFLSNIVFNVQEFNLKNKLVNLTFFEVDSEWQPLIF